MKGGLEGVVIKGGLIKWTRCGLPSIKFLVKEFLRPLHQLPLYTPFYTIPIPFLGYYLRP